MRRLAFVLTLVSFAVLAPAARAAESGQPTIRFRLTADPQTLDWNLAHTSYETYIIMNLMEGLVEEGPDLRPRPALAERWEISPDGKTYTFHLREGVRWSDGRALKASDFVDSWMRLLDPKTHAPYANFLFDIEGAEAFHEGKGKSVGIKALSENRLQIRLRRIMPGFIHFPSFWVTFPVRLDLIRKHGKHWTDPGKIVVVGPYHLKSWNRGKSIELERNASYFGPAPEVPRVEALIEPDDAKARALFESGRIDFLQDPTTQDLVQSKARVEQFPYLATYYLGFNVESGPFRDHRVRKAIASVIDRDQIPLVLQGGQIAARDWIPPGMEGHREDAPVPDYPLHDARAVITAAGFPEGRGFPKSVFWVEKFDGAEAIAAFVAKSVREKLGIELEPRIGTSDEFLKALSTGKADLFINHWGADYPDPYNFLSVFAGKTAGNYTGWSNADYEEDIEKGQATMDPANRLTAFKHAEKILLSKEAPIVPLFYKKNRVLLAPTVSGLSISPLNYLFLKNVKLQTPSPR